jgi:glucose-6-phosphate-specific signal transduction histidine kinase
LPALAVAHDVDSETFALGFHPNLGQENSDAPDLDKILRIHEYERERMAASCTTRSSRSAAKSGLSHSRLSRPDRRGGLCAALRSLARGLTNRTGLKVGVRCADDVPTIGEALSLPLLRVAQEALTNVHRHARATEAKIILRRRRQVLELLIADNGRGTPQLPVQVPTGWACPECGIAPKRSADI